MFFIETILHQAQLALNYQSTTKCWTLLYYVWLVPCRWWLRGVIFAITRRNSAWLQEMWQRGQYNFLALNVRRPNYLGLTRSISWLLIPGLLTSAGHQQPWYSLCRICRSQDLSTCVISMWSNDIRYKCISLQNLGHKELRTHESL